MAAKASVAANTNQGPDMFWGLYSLPHLFPTKLVEVTDVANYLGKKYGGWVATAETYGKSGGKWIAIPVAYNGNVINYRQSMIEKAGFKEIPKDTAGFMQLMKELKAKSAFTVALFWVGKGGLPRWADVNYHLVGGPRYTSRSTNDVLATTNKLRPIVLGNLAVVDELQHGNQPAFADARRDAEIRRFLIAPYLWREQSGPAAERFGRRLIELTSARLGELQRTPTDVGPTADCLSVAA